MHELTHEQWITGRLVPTGCAEGVLGVGRKSLAQKQGGGSGTQGSGPDHGRQRIGDDLPDQSWILSRVFWPEAVSQ